MMWRNADKMALARQALALLAFLIPSPLAGAQVQGSCPLTTPLPAFSPSITYRPSSPVTAEVAAKLDSTIASFIAKASIPQYAVSVVHGERTVYTSGLATTPFRIASVTKVFAALGALILRDRGLLSLDDPVKRFLPDFSVVNPFEPHDITLRELMGHVSGMPPQPCARGLPCLVTESEALAAISKMELVRPPWSREPVYSNVGYALLAHAWEKVTPHKSWKKFIMENIIRPLGMRDTGIDLGNVVLAFNNNSPSARADLGWWGPAGQMYSTAVDLAEFLKFVLTRSPPLISGASISEWTRAASIFPDRLAGFALPWELVLANFTSEFLITKDGLFDSFLSFIAMHPPTQLGVSVLFAVDESSSDSPQTLATLILDILAPAVEAMNQRMVDGYYTGRYECEATAPLYNAALNATFQVAGGFMNISGSPTLGLSAVVNLSLIQNGESGQVVETYAMLLKNSTENSFWVGSRSDTCQLFFGSIALAPSAEDPNHPGSVFFDEITFDFRRNSIMWPAIGAVCVKQK